VAVKPNGKHKGKKTTANRATKPKLAPVETPPVETPADVPMDGLSLLEAEFVSFYVGSAKGSAAESVRLMDLTSGKNRNYDARRRAGSYYLQLPRVREKIDQVMKGFAMSAAEAVAELSSVAYMPTTFELTNGQVLETDPRNVKNKVTALQHVLKYHGLLTEKIKLDIDVTKLNDEQLQQLRTSLGGGGRDRGAEATTTEGDGKED
jgi:hypothetical protein